MKRFVGLFAVSIVALLAQVRVDAPDGSFENVMVGYDGDTAGIFEGTFVTVYATLVGTQSGTNAFGGTLIQPLLVAGLVEVG